MCPPRREEQFSGHHRNKPTTLLDKLSPRLVRLPSGLTSSLRGNPPTESAGFGGSRLQSRGYPGTGDVGRVSTSANTPFSVSASSRASCRSGVPPKSTCSAVTRSSMSATGSHAAHPGGPFLRASVAFVVVVVAVVARRAGVASPQSESEASESDVGGVCERIVASERMPRRGRGAARSAERDVPGEGEREEDGGGERVENIGGERDEDGGGERGEDRGGGERDSFTGGGDFRLRGVIPHPAGEKSAGDSSRSGGRESKGSDADGL